MSITSAAKTSTKEKTAMLAEIDYMLAEMKKADVRIAAIQAESDILSEEIRENMVRINASNDELRQAVEKTRDEADGLRARRTNAN